MAKDEENTDMTSGQCFVVNDPVGGFLQFVA